MLSNVITVVPCSVESHGYVYIILGVLVNIESIRYIEPTGSVSEEPGATRFMPTLQFVMLSCDQV